MGKTIWASMFAAAALTLGSEARAQANLHSGDVLRPGDNMIYGEVGWPDLAFGWQHGLTDKVDIGIRAGFIYGWEYTQGVAYGFGVRVPIRITPLRRGKVSLQIHIDPGLKFDNFGTAYGVTCVQTDRFGNCIQYAGTYYGYYGWVTDALHFGLWADFGLDVGIHLTPDVTLTPSFEMPLFINFTNGTYGAIPLLFGASVQYNINDRMSVGGSLKFGPSILAVGNYAGCGFVGPGVYGACPVPAPFGFITNGFFAYRL
jgi:hypothetical protein